MNIIYDIDTLGERFKNKGAQTGVFRVVENIAHGIAKEPGCNPVWCAERYYEDAKNYIADDSLLAQFPMLYSEPHLENVFFRMNALLISKRSNAIQAYQQNPRRYQQLPHKIYRKLLALSLKFLKPIVPPESVEINPKLLSEANLYHATWWKPPVAIRQQRHLTFFYTIYDLIPILYPQYVSYNEDYPSKRMMEDMDEESWGVSISQSSKNDLCNYNNRIDEKKIIVTPLAADTHIFYQQTDNSLIRSVQRKYTIPEQPYFLSLCTLAPHKNITHVIRSFCRLVEDQNLKDVNLVLVGSKGWEFDDIFNAISQYKHLQSRIIVTGRASDEDLSALYSGSLGFVFMSLYEGFGLPPLEAMQCGVPVITSNTSSLPEVVGDAGIMLDPTDEDGLCQAMLNLHNSSSLREEMAQKSLRQAAKFSWDKTVQQTIQGYQMALKQ